MIGSKLRYAISKTIVIGIIVIVVVALIAGIILLTFRPTAPVTTTPTAKFKLAAIFPGTIQDADYNTLGYLALMHVKTKYGIDVAYSERVAVPDAERIMKEYIALGYNIIWAHGGQFLAPILKLAKEHPEVVFIGVAYEPLKDHPPNLWIIDSNFHIGFYVLGAIAALSTKTGKIGYIGGIDLPFTKAEVNAILEAIKKYNPDAELIYVWVGDFNDPVKTRSLAESLIAQGVDFILSSVNLGNYGLFEAVKAEKERKILLTVKYTDKSVFIPEHFVTSYIYDYGAALDHIISKIMEGQRGGYYEMEFGKECYILLPLKNVPSDIEEEVKKIINDIIEGKLVIEYKPEIER